MSKDLIDRIKRNAAIEEYSQGVREREPSPSFEYPSYPPEGEYYSVSVVRNGHESEGLAVGISPWCNGRILQKAVSILPGYLVKEHHVESAQAEQIVSKIMEAATLFKSPTGDDVLGRIELIRRVDRGDQPGSLQAVAWTPFPSAMVLDLQGGDSYPASQLDEHNPVFESVFFLR